MWRILGRLGTDFNLAATKNVDRFWWQDKCIQFCHRHLPKWRSGSWHNIAGKNSMMICHISDVGDKVLPRIYLSHVDAPELCRQHRKKSATIPSLRHHSSMYSMSRVNLDRLLNWSKQTGTLYLYSRHLSNGRAWTFSRTDKNMIM